MGKKRISLFFFFVTFQFSQIVMAVPPEDVVKYRQGILFGIGWNVGAMGAMVKGDMPFDRDQFLFFAKRMAALTPMVLEGFKPETKDVKSYTKPETWENLVDFESRMSRLLEETEKLVEVAKNGEEVEIKKQFGKTAQQCKGCHDNYKKKS